MLRFLPRDARQPGERALIALRPYEGVMARLLFARGVESAAQAEGFLRPCLSQLHDPMLLHDMEKTVALLEAAKEACIPAVVYGDYDVDGICATSLLTDALRRFGLNAQPHIPLREEGYGLNLASVERLAKDYGLLITVDLGVTNHEEVRRARELGMTVIVTDHHQLGLEESPAHAVVSPLLGGYPCPRLCGTGVAFKLAQALLGLDVAAEYLDLAALATVADIVPLTDENRTLVALGLPVIESRAREGMRALLAVCGGGDTVNSETLGFQLGPRLNAAGRLADAGLGVRLMLTRDPAEADEIARELDTLNIRRKAMENEVLTQALEQAQTHDFVKERALIVRGEGWHVGVIGLAAGRLCQRYGCPTVALSQEEGVLHGSLRSVPGVNIHKCLQALDDLLLRYGGHEQAAGVTLAEENYEAFCRRLQEAVSRGAAEEAFVPVQEYDLPLPLGEATLALAGELNLLAPFGQGNPAPIFLAENVRLERRRACGAGGAHLQLTLREGGQVLDGIAFGMGQEAALLPDQVDAALSLSLDTFRGVTRVKAEVKAIRAARNAAENAVAQAEASLFEEGLLAALEECGVLGLQAGKREESPEIKKVEGDAWPPPARGALYVARCRESALALLESLEGKAPLGLELCWGAPRDPLCFPTLLLLPRLCQVSGCWRQVVLLDGELLPGEAALWRERLPLAEVAVGPYTPAFQALAAAVDGGDMAYRGLYKLLRSHAFASLAETAKAAGLTAAQARAGLAAFAQLNLIRFTASPFAYTLLPPAPCDLSDSHVLGALRGIGPAKP